MYFKYDPSISSPFSGIIFGNQDPVLTAPVATPTFGRLGPLDPFGWDYLELPDGLYSVSDLNTAFRRLIGRKTAPNTTTRYNTNSITISENSSTQHIIVEMRLYTRNFAFSKTILCTFGITTLDNDASVIRFLHDNDYWEGDTTAQLTPINSFLLHRPC